MLKVTVFNSIQVHRTHRVSAYERAHCQDFVHLIRGRDSRSPLADHLLHTSYRRILIRERGSNTRISELRHSLVSPNAKVCRIESFTAALGTLIFYQLELVFLGELRILHHFGEWRSHWRLQFLFFFDWLATFELFISFFCSDLLWGFVVEDCNSDHRALKRSDVICSVPAHCCDLADVV